MPLEKVIGQTFCQPHSKWAHLVSSPSVETVGNSARLAIGVGVGVACHNPMSSLDAFK